MCRTFKHLLIKAALAEQSANWVSISLDLSVALHLQKAGIAVINDDIE